MKRKERGDVLQVGKCVRISIELDRRRGARERATGGAGVFRRRQPIDDVATVVVNVPWYNISVNKLDLYWVIFKARVLTAVELSVSKFSLVNGISDPVVEARADGYDLRDEQERQSESNEREVLHIGCFVDVRRMW